MKKRLVRSWMLAGVLVPVFAAAPVSFGPEAQRAARTRAAALAGTWYPAGRARLVAAAHLLMRLSAAAPVLPAKPLVLVVPHAGWNYSGFAAAAAFRQLGPGDFDRVVVVAPSHHTAFRGYALDDATAYATPLGDVPVCDGAFAVLAGAGAQIVPGASEPEHAVEVELPFLQAALDRFCLVPVLVGDTGPDEERAFAERLARLDDGRTLFVFSSDFSHYGPRFDYQPFGPLSPGTLGKVQALNERAIAILARLDARGFRAYLEETGNTICGRHGLETMLELLARIAPKATAVTLARYASGEIPGMNDDSSVSYVAMAFLREPVASPPPGPPLAGIPRLEDAPPGTPALTPVRGAQLVRIARAALVTQLVGGDSLGRELRAWPTSPAEERRQGVFVTLNRTNPEAIRTQGRLRGCIGQPDPAFPLYYGTVEAALDAALGDPRFEPVTAGELGGLEVEVTALSPRTPVASWRDIRLGTHGIVLEKGDRRALFLPQVAPEQGWTLEQTLSALAEKAGLPADGWKQGARFSVFTAQVFEEHP
jgi:AmmeMemoRadiSam system protein B/AmmeMemoRadiSam system protein A